MRNGKIRYVHERCKSDFNSSGKPIRSLGTVADITDRIQIENELKLASEKSEERKETYNILQQILKHFSIQLMISCLSWMNWEI